MRLFFKTMQRYSFFYKDALTFLQKIVKKTLLIDIIY